MCLACEMDAWWFAEMEAAALRASSPLPGGERACPGLDPRSTVGVSETAGEGSLNDRWGENPSPGSRSAASGRPGGDPTSPQRGEVANAFSCQETCSE